MPLPPGSRFGPYEIVSALGAGGMGEVYRARDPRLGRDVAIKVLQESVAADPERLRRFTVEAQAVAALNHPNVLTIYEVGVEPTTYLATELLEGETLRARLDAGALPYSKAIDYARQAAAGLAAAHAKGIAHRDIKPENLFITADGRLKILDFGLAKALGPADGGHGSTAEATRLQSATAAGIVMGTAGYMSPEQVRAQPLDHRTDIFSLGIVLYEMLAGQRPFVAASAVETMNAILTMDPPEIVATGRSLPAAAAQVVRHCLEKNPEERFQSARDLSFALQSLAGFSGSGSASAVGSGPAAAGASSVSRARLQWMPLAVTLLAGLAVGATVMMLARPQSAATDLASYRFTPVATDADPEWLPVWSPDGRSIAFVKGSRIFVRSANTDDPTPVTAAGTEVFDLFWFPDNVRIGFANTRGVWSVSRAGGDPELLQAGPAEAASLSPDGGTLAYWKLTTVGTLRTAALWFASPINAPAKKYEAGFVDVLPLTPVYLRYSPDGKRLAISGNLPGPTVWLIPTGATGSGNGPPTRLFQEKHWQLPPQVSWLPDNQTLVLTHSNNAEQPGIWLADVDRGSWTKLTAGVERVRDPHVSADGRRILFTAGVPDYDLVEIPIGSGPIADLLSTSRMEFGAVWAPARPSEIAYLTDKGGAHEIRTRRLDDGSERIIVGPHSFPDNGAADLVSASLSSDGTRVLFARFDGKNGFVWVAPMAGGAPVRIDAGTTNEWMATWSPDGKEVAYSTTGEKGARLLKRRLGSTEPPVVLIDAIATLYGCLIEWSPTGDWIAHDSPEGLGLVSPDGKSRRLLSKTRARAVAWSRDGRTIFALLLRTSELVSIDVSTGQTRQLRTFDPSITFSAPDNPGLRLSLSPDGTKLLTTIVRDRSDIWMLER